MYQSLQACRGIAALLVLLFHLGGTFASAKYFGYAGFDRFFGWGDAGADIFFVLSGFIIATTHRGDIGRPDRLGRYVRRRLTRVYPTYWIVFIAVYVASLVLPGLQSVPRDAWTVAKSLLLIPQDPAVVGGTGAPVLFVAWTLQYEMMFYACMAGFIASRIVGLIVLGGLLALQLACGFGGACAFPYSFLSSHLVWLFGFGALAAYGLDRPALQWPRPKVVATLGAVVMVLFGLSEKSWLPQPLPVDRVLVYGVLAAVIVMALVQAERLGAFARKYRWTAALGDSSYALYLLHIPLISLCVKLFAAAHLRNVWLLTGAFIVSALLCIAAAVLFHRWIEAPMLRLLAARKPARAPTVENALTSNPAQSFEPHALSQDAARPLPRFEPSPETPHVHR